MAKRLVIRVGEYEGKDQDGNPKTKGEYIRLGVIIQGEHGEFALIDPTVDLAGCLLRQRLMNAGKEKKGKGDMIMVSVFNDNQNQQQSQQSPQRQDGPPPVFDDFDQDIPF